MSYGKIYEASWWGDPTKTQFGNEYYEKSNEKVRDIVDSIVKDSSYRENLENLVEILNNHNDFGLEQPSLALIPSSYSEGKIHALGYDFNFSRPTTVDRIDSKGVTETIQPNIPKIDYETETVVELGPNLHTVGDYAPGADTTFVTTGAGSLYDQVTDIATTGTHYNIDIAPGVSFTSGSTYVVQFISILGTDSTEAFEVFNGVSYEKMFKVPSNPYNGCFLQTYVVTMKSSTTGLLVRGSTADLGATLTYWYWVNNAAIYKVNDTQSNSFRKATLTLPQGSTIPSTTLNKDYTQIPDYTIAYESWTDQSAVENNGVRMDNSGDNTMFGEYQNGTSRTFFFDDADNTRLISYAVTSEEYLNVAWIVDNTGGRVKLVIDGEVVQDKALTVNSRINSMRFTSGESGTVKLRSLFIYDNALTDTQAELLTQGVYSVYKNGQWSNGAPSEHTLDKSFRVMEDLETGIYTHWKFNNFFIDRGVNLLVEKGSRFNGKGQVVSKGTLVTLGTPRPTHIVLPNQKDPLIVILRELMQNFGTPAIKWKVTNQSAKDYFYTSMLDSRRNGNYWGFGDVRLCALKEDLTPEIIIAEETAKPEYTSIQDFNTSEEFFNYINSNFPRGTSPVGDSDWNNTPTDGAYWGEIGMFDGSGVELDVDSLISTPSGWTYISNPFTFPIDLAKLIEVNRDVFVENFDYGRESNASLSNQFIDQHSVSYLLAGKSMPVRLRKGKNLKFRFTYDMEAPLVKSDADRFYGEVQSVTTDKDMIIDSTPDSAFGENKLGGEELRFFVYIGEYGITNAIIIDEKVRTYKDTSGEIPGFHPDRKQNKLISPQDPLRRPAETVTLFPTFENDIHIPVAYTTHKTGNQTIRLFTHQHYYIKNIIKDNIHSIILRDNVSGQQVETTIEQLLASNKNNQFAAQVDLGSEGVYQKDDRFEIILKVK